MYLWPVAEVDAGLSSSSVKADFSRKSVAIAAALRCDKFRFRPFSSKRLTSLVSLDWLSSEMRIAKHWLLHGIGDVFTADDG